MSHDLTNEPQKEQICSKCFPRSIEYWELFVKLNLLFEQVMRERAAYREAGAKLLHSWKENKEAAFNAIDDEVERILEEK